MYVSALYTYPVKSLAGNSVPVLNFDERGPLGDRRYMVVDADNRFLTQRQLPAMACVRVEETVEGITLSAAGHGALVVTPAHGTERRCVQVWHDQVDALDLGEASASWLSTVLGVPARLVYQDALATRSVDARYATQPAQVSFADGFPLLLTTEASLAAINEALEPPLPMISFRPNLVVAGGEAFAEDGWRRIRIDGVELELVKPCSRCVIPSINPDTGEKRRDVLRRLAALRRGRDGQVYFGQNLLIRTEAVQPDRLALRLHSEVELLE